MTAKLGRPRKSMAALQKHTVALRLRPGTKAALTAAAERNERSYAEEARARIERSLADDTELGGPELVEIARLLAGALRRGGGTAAALQFDRDVPASTWLRDAWCFEQGVLAMARVMGELAPPGPPVSPTMAEVRDDLGDDRREIATAMVKTIVSRIGPAAGNATVRAAGRRSER